MPLVRIPWKDPRLQPGAYISKGPWLCEVLRPLSSGVVLENCRTLREWRIPPLFIIQDWRLVRPAPSTPDVPSLNPTQGG
jgi:hypothetical protein